MFVVFILLWCFVGFLGVWNCKENRTNYGMLLFLLMAPFIPLIAHLCKLI